MSALSREISNRLSSTLPTSGRIPVSTLLALPGMTPCPRGFLEHELEIAIGEDLSGLRAHFQVPDQLEASSFRTVHLGLIGMGAVTVGDAHRLLEKALEEAIAYLSAPRSFLLRNLAESDEVTLDDNLLRYLSRLREYEYFPDVLRLWIERLRAEGIQGVSRGEFSALLRRIDQGMIAHHELGDVQELLMPLAVLVGGAIPRALLVDFFSDKSMHRVASHVGSLPSDRIAVAELPAILAAIHGSERQMDQTVARQQLLAELRAAGVVFGPTSDSRLLESIQSRPLPPDASHTSLRE